MVKAMQDQYLTNWWRDPSFQMVHALSSTGQEMSIAPFISISFRM